MELQIQKADKTTYATQVMVNVSIHKPADKKSRFKAAPMVRLIFIDELTKQAVADIALPATVAENVSGLLDKQLALLADHMKSGKPFASQEATTAKPQPSYVG